MAQLNGTRNDFSEIKPVREVIIVDDNDDWRELLAAILELEGYRVTGFADAEAFLKEASMRLPICVFVDVVMPGISGMELLQNLHATSYKAPVFLISARADAPLVAEGKRHGALDFIEKPFDPYTAVLRVRDAADIWMRRAEKGIESAIESGRFAGKARLTRRERGMLAQIAVGASNRQAADSLGMSRHDALELRHRIRKKLGIKGAGELVQMAFAGSTEPRTETVLQD
jgi:two-component system, LuxR family, response regulator FixJ